QAADLRQAGPVVPVELLGEVAAWSVTRHSAVMEVLTHPQVKKNPKYWRAWRNGEIPPDWQLISWVAADNMLARDDEDHTRLRKLVSKAFTRSEEHTSELQSREK